MRLPIRRALRAAVAGLSVLLLSAACHRAPEPAAAPDASGSGSPASAKIVTSDIPNFWRAFDLAAGADSAERVRIFREVYLRPGSEGLRDWARVRLADRRHLMAVLESAGWTEERAMRAYYGAPRGDTLREALEAVLAPHVELSAAEQIARATAAWPRYYAGVRVGTLAIDTSTALKSSIDRGLRRLHELYPEGELRDIYFLIGRLTSGGTIGPSGMLLGTELSTRADDTPLDELPEFRRAMTSGKTAEQLAHLVIHEAVHTLQTGDGGGGGTLLAAAIREGGADFLAELATGIRPDFAIYHKYGRANERQVWAEFVKDMNGRDNLGSWLGSWAREDNHGAPDLGYWVGYRIAEAYYNRAADKKAAVRELLLVRDAQEILRASGYGTEFR